MKKLLIILFLVANNIYANERNRSIETAYLAGGCYWGLEELMRKLPGVTSTQVGFSGGQLKNATYLEVSTGRTGHAESIEVKYDSKVLDYKNLLLYFFKIHDPTTINQQGNDKGTQYRSAIFYVSEQQKEIAQNVIGVVDQSKLWDDQVVTEVVAFSAFYLAKESHQKYLKKNPKGYSCHFERKFEFLKKK